MSLAKPPGVLRCLLACRPQLGRPLLTLLVALWMMLVFNAGFWNTVWQGVGGWGNGSKLFLASLPLLVGGWLFLLLALLAWSRLTKPVLGLLLLVSAGTSYFMHSFGIVIDYEMVTNLIQTDPDETLDLLTPGLLLWVLLVGALPALLLQRVKLRDLGWRRELFGQLGAMGAALAVVLGVALSFYQPYASLIRNHREVRLELVPSNVLAATHGYLRRELKANRPLERVGLDAHRFIRVGSASKPRVTLLVVGETARAANFSLNGYARETTPELARREVINYPQASSCGTATAVSVPCMFQGVGRDHYRDELATTRESLLDVLQRAGVAVLWRDNNSGCKGVCDRVPHEDLSRLEVAALCGDGECHDGVLLEGLQAYLDNLQEDAVVVLHMKGSHGPAYFKRYPAEFERFTPVCRDKQLDRCDQQSIVNGYDNSLRYTDHVLAQAIDLLKRNEARFDTAMIYLSDHGESLGEKGLYLHGIPYAMAPEQQTHIPMLMWLSDGLRVHAGLNAACLSEEAVKPVSQDNLYHSVLGLMGVQTNVYESGLDLFQACRQQPTAQQ